jgi:FKBP-type peptidyl-prolyl cis-trans isomerase FklB
MYKIFLPLFTLFFITGISFSQTTKPVVKPASKPVAKATVAPVPVLKNLRDSASYAMGLFVINVFSQQGINDINSDIVAKAIKDVQTNKPQLLNENEANIAIMTFQNKLQALKSKPTIDAGMKFLSDNRSRPGVITTASGLQYEILTEGLGLIPTIGDSVTCNYIGSYINGTEFENSYKSGSPITFAVTGVIRGWTEALQLMPVGSKWKVFIPYQLGYGASDYYSIPGGSTLIFELELISIKGK